MFEFRVDAGELQPAKRMEDGRLVAEALITKPGVFEYLDSKYPGGIRRELRPDDEVYSRETMDSFASLPITSGHPPKLITSATAKNYSVGMTGEKAVRTPVSGDADWVKSKLVVYDERTIKRMDVANATSVGYACIIENKSGVDPKYGRFDVIQRKIRGNHLAVAIEDGRAGHMARVRMDESNYSATIARLDSNSKLTTSTDGHQHLVSFCDWDHKPTSSGSTSWAQSAGADSEHSHAWVRNGDGSITIADSAGHSHTIIDAAAPPQLGVGLRNDTRETSSPGMVPGQRFDHARSNGETMDLEKLQEANRALEAGLKLAEKERDALSTRADSAEKERDVAVGRIDTLEKDLASLRVQIAAGATAAETAAIVAQRERADTAEAKVARFDETYQGAVRARTTLVFRAASAMGEDFRMDDLTDDQIRRAVVKRLDATADVGIGVPEGVITGQFEQLLKSRLVRARQDARVSTVLGTTNEQNRNDTRTEKMRAYQDQGKRPLSELFGKKGA